MSWEIETADDGEFATRIVIGEDRIQAGLASLLATALDQVEVEPIQLWIRSVAGSEDSVAAGLGFVPYRDLWQLRCLLPAQASGLTTRAFSQADIDEFVTVNSRAFSWHPEQGRLTASDVGRLMTEAWFDADGFRLHHLDGRLSGFCWTKIHRDHDPALGEIYAIAVDPDFQGRGLGRPLTLAGLEWLASKGLTDGMLYVESDNVAANSVYRRIGFRRHHTDRVYRRGHKSTSERNEPVT